jgi:hypothetical protein
MQFAREFQHRLPKYDSPNSFGAREVCSPIYREKIPEQELQVTAPFVFR